MPRTMTTVAPALILGLGCLGLFQIGDQAEMSLRKPLDELPRVVAGLEGVDLAISEEEQQAAGMTSFTYRAFTRDSRVAFTVYVGFYEAQSQGRSIHSPKNCLPGGGWEPVSSGSHTFPVGEQSVTVNRYVIEKDGVRALAYYWYQGRGRLAWNEYRVKWDLLRDKALYGRSDEALVRIIIPLTPQDEDGVAGDALAETVAEAIIRPLNEILPAFSGSRNSASE